ncbi:hypothetical protein [Sphingobacterium yanglingense]|nr:hypothetical protein [Sphingobacterium yanglingense]
MGLKPRFTRSVISQAVEKHKAQFREAVINRFELVGWEFVKAAREKTANEGGFNDVTGNLRSSIGFAIVDHGRIVQENFDGAQAIGKQEAESFISELLGDFEDGYALIVVAGMGYAAAVESKGKDVITGSSLEAEATLKTAIRMLKRSL